MDNIFRDKDFIKNKQLINIIDYIAEKDLELIDKIINNSIQVKNSIEIIDYIDIKYIEEELMKIKDDKYRIKIYTLILINYSFDLTFNLYDNKTISKLFSLNVNIDKKLFDLVEFKYGKHNLKLKNKLVFSLQKNMNIKLLEFLIKHFKKDLTFKYFKINHDFLYSSNLNQEFIKKSMEIGLFDMNDLNIKAQVKPCSALDFIGREKVFHDANENPNIKKSFIFLYSLGINYNFELLSQEYKTLINEIKFAKNNLEKNKRKLNLILQTIHIDILNQEKDILKNAENTITTLESIKLDIINIKNEIELGNLELKRLEEQKLTKKKWSKTIV